MAMNDVDWANIFAALGGSAPQGQSSGHTSGQSSTTPGQAGPSGQASAGGQQPLASPRSEHGVDWAQQRHTHSTSSSFSIAHDPPRGIGTASDLELGYFWPHHGPHPAQHAHPQDHHAAQWPSAPGSTSSASAKAAASTAAAGTSGTTSAGVPPAPPTTPANTRAARTRTRSSVSVHTASTSGSGSNTPPGPTPALTPIAPAPPGSVSRRNSTVNTPAAEEEDVEDKRVRNTLACECPSSFIQPLPLTCPRMRAHEHAEQPLYFSLIKIWGLR